MYVRVLDINHYNSCKCQSKLYVRTATGCFRYQIIIIYVDTAGVCSDVDPVRYNGDLWNISRCEYCICNKGKVQCHKAVCETTVCLKVG